jgi:hypothetical protein
MKKVQEGIKNKQKSDVNILQNFIYKNKVGTKISEAERLYSILLFISL